jgi:DNA-binding FadR family transcriptional regulator
MTTSSLGTGLNPSSRRAGRTPKTSELVARDLVNHIVDNKLVEGTKLPNEKQLVEVFDVGRTTLREALRLLETRGVITIRPGPGGGPVVRRPRPDDLREGLTLILQFSGASLMDVFQARATLEPMMARLATEKLTDAQIDELADSVQRMRDHNSDHDVFLEENQRFHSIIAEATGSNVLWVFNETLKSMADGAVVGVEYTPRRRLAVAGAHEHIVDALRARDAEAAERAMSDHVGEAGEFWRRKYPELTARDVRWVQ